MGNTTSNDKKSRKNKLKLAHKTGDILYIYINK
jgi:hypothetical protein